MFGCFEQETPDPPSDDSVLMTKIFTHIDSIYTYRFYLHTRAYTAIIDWRPANIPS